MRHIATAGFLVLFGTILIAASPQSLAAQEATPTSECPATSEAENEALVLRWSDDVINGGTLSAIDEIVASDVIHHAGTFPDGEGPEAIKQVLGALLVGFPDVQQTVEQVISEDDLVVTRWTSTGTHEGEFQGMAATGLPVTWTGINIFRIECGLIAEEWSEVDGLGRAAQLAAG
jgi:steroid delta-isomerase-like uncharacterized protein